MSRSPIIPISLLFITVLASACLSGHLTISVLEPASVTLPASIKRVSILPMPGVPEPPGEFDSLKYIKLDPMTDVREIKMGYLHGIYDIMAASPRFQKVMFNDTLNKGLLARGYLTWDIIDQICARDSTDFLLLLNKVVSYDLPGSVYVFAGESGNLSSYKIINHTKWAFYESGKHTLLTAFYLTDTVMAEGEFSITEVENFLYQACYISGYKAGINICPSWDDNVDRVFFIGHGREMRNATRLVMKNQWYDAASIWNKLAESPKRTFAARAAYNLALAYERDDILDQALLWIAYADSLRSNIATVTYKKILVDRLKNRIKLDEQLAGF